MRDDGRPGDGQSAGTRARNPQPAGEPRGNQLGAPVPASTLRKVDAPHRRETRRLQENIDRRMADQHMVLLLARDGFAGRRYERFAEELARYGISVFRAWMHSGFLFQLLAAHGFDLHPDEHEIEELARDGDVREELATMTVARALPRFRQRALVEGGWNRDGGASVATYFIGACVYEFPNEYRRHRSHQERWRRAVHQAGATAENPTVNNVASEVLGRLRVLDDLTNICDPRMRTAVALTLDDYTQEEIKEILGASSVRAVEGLLYRWRTAARREEGERHG
ncbi:hypothetical protein GCM10010245_49680 [Streptomyces spectabilis]|nr:hypothetical protein GCM10010245_49680 [Streptomyces spectabilis]